MIILNVPLVQIRLINVLINVMKVVALVITQENVLVIHANLTMFLVILQGIA